MANENKMTQVQALEQAIAQVADEDVKAVLQHMLDTKRKPRAKRENKEAAQYREAIAAAMADINEPKKAGEIAEHPMLVELNPEGKAQPQKVANNLRVMVKQGIVEKIPGEKAKEAATYQLA